MPFVIAKPCVGLKDRSCVDECPVDCIYEADDQLLIHPDDCIECHACVPACPVDAIFPEPELPPAWEPFLTLARQWFAAHPDASGGAATSPYAPLARRGDG